MPEFLETTVDKFTFRVPTDRMYCSEGLWVCLDGTRGGNRVRVGLTDYLQQHSGDAAFVTVKPAGTTLQAGEELAVMESIKATLTLASPVCGLVVAANEELVMSPELVNQSPYDKGWLAEIEISDWAKERSSLLEPEAYFAAMKSEAEEEAKKL